MQTTKNSNESINLVKELISMNNIKYYEYENFYNIEKISKKIYRANCKNSEKYIILKSFNSDDYITKEELVHEVIIK
jgi:hypothetical protein